MRNQGLGLYLFCKTAEHALLAEQAGVDGIFLDWEQRGKSERQNGYDTEINDLGVEELREIRPLTSKQIMVRINGLSEHTDGEIEVAVSAGATQVILSMARSAGEVEQFIEVLGGRAEAFIMIETQSLIDEIGGLSSLKWKGAFIGLNDLMISRCRNFLWEPLLDGTVDRLFSQFPEREIGYGGVTLLDRGAPIPFKMLLQEMARHGCAFSFLRRSFYRDLGEASPKVECQKILQYWQFCRQRIDSQVEQDHRRLMDLLTSSKDEQEITAHV